MKLACAVVGVSALFVAVPTLAETCDRPVVVTGGQVAMSSHPTQVRHEAQPVRVAIVAGDHGLPVRAPAGANAASAAGVVTVRCHGCCQAASGKAALSADSGMKDCRHDCGCAHR